MKQKETWILDNQAIKFMQKQHMIHTKRNALNLAIGYSLKKALRE